MTSSGNADPGNLEQYLGTWSSVWEHGAIVNFLVRIVALVLVLGAFGTLGGCSGPPKGGTEVAPMKTDPGPVTEGAASDEYIIGAGDQLSVFVYRNPDLSEGGVAV